jgi:CBS domain-containing protein
MMIKYSSPVIVAEPTSTLHDALVLMQKNQIKRIVIVTDNVPVGIITERDIGRFLSNDKTSMTLDVIPIHKVMSKNVIKIQSDTKKIFCQCAIMMDAFHIGSVIVINKEGRLDGIITRADLVKKFSDVYGVHQEVRDYMSQKLITCRSSDIAEYALKLLCENNVSRVVVTDSQGRPNGIITHELFLRNNNYNQTKSRDYPLPAMINKILVSDLIGNEIISVSESDNLKRAARLMSLYKINGLPVVDSREFLVGAITSMDIVHAYRELVVEKIVKKNYQKLINMQ